MATSPARTTARTKGLGEGGERLHYWVFGGPWSYESPARCWATFMEFAVRR